MFGISSQEATTKREVIQRLHLPFAMLADTRRSSTARETPAWHPNFDPIAGHVLEAMSLRYEGKPNLTRLRTEYEFAIDNKDAHACGV